MNIRKIALMWLVIALLSGCAPAVSPITPAPSLVPATEMALPTAAGDLAPPLASEPPTVEAPPATLSPATIPTQPPDTTPAIILLIGDGMGASHRQAATWLAVGSGGMLVMDSLSVHGSARTASANQTVTDSAAAATAMATGQLTNNLYLGVDPQGSPLKTILEIAQEQGWSVGLVTTVPLAHATPAAFAVHYPDRADLPEIAEMLLAAGVDVLLGGGEDDFHASNTAGCFPGKGHQPKEGDLIEAAAAQGYTTICSREELLTLDTSATTRLLGVFGAEEILAPYNPSLSEMTQTALAILSQDPDGFFLMVEGGQIDWAAHENKADETMQNTIGLDTAVTMAKIFTLGRPNTLMIVAADHETGGMSLNLDGSGSYRQDGPFHMPDGTPFWVDWSTGSHTGLDIPVTAEGPNAELLAGEYPLTQLFEAMRLMVEP